MTTSPVQAVVALVDALIDCASVDGAVARSSEKSPRTQAAKAALLDRLASAQSAGAGVPVAWMLREADGAWKPSLLNWSSDPSGAKPLFYAHTPLAADAGLSPMELHAIKGLEIWIADAERNGGWIVGSAYDFAQRVCKALRRLGARGVDEDLRELLADALDNLAGWGKAYPLDIFPEPTKEQRDWLHATRPGLMDRIAASMGRHIAECIARDVAKLQAALARPEGSP